MFDDLNRPLILFDSECKLCNGSIRFIVERDRDNSFNYLPIKSEEAKRILKEFDDRLKNSESILLIIDDKIMEYSTAVLTITRYLSGFWPVVYGLIIIPEFIRDPIYKFIASRRHKWFVPIAYSEHFNE